MLEIKISIIDDIQEYGQRMPTYKAKLIDYIKNKAKKAGPVRTFLMALHLGNSTDSPLSVFTKNLEVLSEELTSVFTDDEFNMLLGATGSAFRYFKEFTPAAHFFRRAGYNNALNSLAELSYEFGNIEGVRKTDEYLKEDNKPRKLPDKKSLKKFLIEKVIPALSLGGDQYHGFRFDQSEIEALKKEVGNLNFRSLTKASACWLLEQGVKDIARLYILSIHSEDSILIGQVGQDFTKQATLPRRRTVEILQSAFPDSSVEVLKKGDTFSVRPKFRFVVKVTHEDGTSCILKEILGPVSNIPVERNFLMEQEVLSAATIEGIPKFSKIVTFEGLSFLQICHMKGDSLQHLRAIDELPEQKTILDIVHSLLRIVRDLHSKKIAHLDISEKNILFDGEKVSLIGFDNACKLSKGETIWFTPPPSQNVTPEVAEGFKAEIKSDCFQLGLLIHRLLTGKHVFGWPEISTESEVMTTLKQIDYIIPMLYREPDIDTDILHPAVVSVLKGLLQKAPVQRMSAKEAYDKINEIIPESAPRY